MSLIDTPSQRASNKPSASSIELPSQTYVPATMPQLLTTRSLITLFILTVFWPSNSTGIAISGPASFTYWAIGIFCFFLPCILIISQLAVVYPYEGSLYNWTYHALGASWSVFVSICSWLPGVLSLISAGFVIVNVIQALNTTWLTTPQEQGLVIIGVVFVSGCIASLQLATVRNLMNIAAVFIAAFVFLQAVAMVLWLIQGHHSATSMDNLTAWQINASANPQLSNISVFGSVTLALLGATMPLALAGEVRSGTSLRRHLWQGALLTIVGYLVINASLLVIEGPQAIGQVLSTSGNSVQLLTASIDTVMGKFMGNIAAILLMCFFVIVPAAENLVSARLLMVGGIDQRLPSNIARLNKNRVPMRAIWFQTICACMLAVILFLGLPLLNFLNNPAVLTSECYLVIAASLLLVWAFSFLFPFIDFLILSWRDRAAFRQHRIAPQSLLLLCCLIGPLICILTIGDTLFNSWAPALINNTSWLWLVGSVTIAFLIICAIGSIIARGQANWERWDE